MYDLAIREQMRSHSPSHCTAELFQARRKLVRGRPGTGQSPRGLGLRLFGPELFARVYSYKLGLVSHSRQYRSLEMYPRCRVVLLQSPTVATHRLA